MRSARGGSPSNALALRPFAPLARIGSAASSARVARCDVLEFPGLSQRILAAYVLRMSVITGSPTPIAAR